MKIFGIILLILLGLLQFRLWFSAGGMQDLRHLQQLKQQQSAENAQLRERNRSLAAEVLDLKQGHAAIEERARSELGMIQRGEVFYQLIETDGFAPPPDTDADSP
ncbi:MAG: cell division protein FtsB [Gammaproteobacteria bacterium]